MRTILPAIIVFACFAIQGQVNFNRAYHDKSESASFVSVLNNEVYLFTMNREGQNIGRYNVYRHNNSGTLISKTTFMSGKSVFGIQNTVDGQFLTIGVNILCKDFTDGKPQVNFVAKLTPAANAIFTTTFTTSEGDHPRSAVEMADSSYYVFSDTCMFHFSKTGQLLSKVKPGITNVASALPLSNNNILVSAKISGSPSLIEVAGTGAIISSKSNSVLLRKMLFYKSEQPIGIGTDNKLYKFAEGNDLITASSFTGGMNVQDIAIKSDTIYSILYTANTSVYCRIDTSFNMVSQSTSSTQAINQKAIRIFNNKIAIIGSGNSATNHVWYDFHSFSYLSVIDKTGSNNFSQDIALLSVEADSTYAIKTANGPVHFLYLKPKIIIRNNGTGIVTNFKLNCATGPGLCGHSFYQEQFSGFSLPPNGTLTLTSSTFISKYFELYNSTVTDEFCLYTTVPNTEVDKTFSDNELCKSFTFIVTSIGEEKRDGEITISPNPFNEELTIAATSVMKKINVFDCVGTQIKSFLVERMEFKLHEDVAPGIYLFCVETEKGVFVKKVIRL